jgi:hypothetical protein
VTKQLKVAPYPPLTRKKKYMSMSRLITRQMMSAVGTFTANGSTAVVVNPSVPIGANSMIRYTLKTVGGTPAGAPYESAITAGAVGTATFSVKAAVGDTSVYNYTILG